MNRAQPSPGPKPVEQAKAAAAAVGDAAKATGKTVMGTVERVLNFVDGTIRGALDGCAKFGRWGFKLGIAAGIAALFIPGGVMVSGFLFSGLALPFYGALAGAVAGSALGAVTGLLTGGYQRLALEGRKEKYATQLAERREMRGGAPARGISTRAYDRARDHVDRITYDKIDQYNDRIREDQGGWTDRVDASRGADSHLGR